MDSVTPGSAGPDRRRLTATIRDSLRSLRIQLALLNHRVSLHAGLKGADLDCLDILSRERALSPTALAQVAGLHPATMTGVLDRLERGGWVVRERGTSDRRMVVVRLQTGRGRELLRLYSGMNASLEEICAGYSEAELEVIAGFLRRAAEAGATATDQLG